MNVEVMRERTKYELTVNAGVTYHIYKRILFSLLKKLPKGTVVIEEDGHRTVFGRKNEGSSGRAVFVVHDKTVYKDFVLGGSIGGAEAYMLGKWSSPELVEVINVLASNLMFLNKLNGSRSILKYMQDKFYHISTKNSEKKAKDNISAHYDLSNEFFSIFLDKTMMYSSAIYSEKNDNLESASINKLATICDKLDLNADDHLLEIGTGWGGLAVYAAKNYGCRVTTTTISQEQYDYAVKNVRQEGLSEYITVLNQDYRNLHGTFDKLVSVEMIEAVGFEYYQTYFEVCNDRLKVGGKALIQAITIPDSRFEQGRKSMDFIKKHIFPGGCLPSEEIIATHISKYTNFSMLDAQEIGLDYAETLREWRERFMSKISDVKMLGFEDSFIRMWEYYLCYCEGGFRQKAIGTAQFLYVKN